MFDTGVWYCVKDLKIFDEKVKPSDYEEATQVEETADEK